MGTTTGGLRYPEPTDPIAQGATAIQNLALDVDARLANIAGDLLVAKLQAGATTATTDATGNTIITHGLGVAPTMVFCYTLQNWLYNVYSGTPTATTFTARVRNIQTSADIANTSLQFRWLAVVIGTL